jgi:hypothetical protein
VPDLSGHVAVPGAVMTPVVIVRVVVACAHLPATAVRQAEP